MVKRKNKESRHDWLTRISRECLDEIEEMRFRAMESGRSLSMEDMAYSAELLRRYDNCQQLLAIEFPEEGKD